MDVSEGFSSLDSVSTQIGHTLTVEQKAALDNSIFLLKSNYKFKKVMFWGKICGVRSDYYLVQGFGEDLLDASKRLTLYSADCVDWAQLPPLEDAAIPIIGSLTGRFLGKASHEYRVKLPPGVEPPESLQRVKREDMDGEGESYYESEEEEEEEEEEGEDDVPRPPRSKTAYISEEKRLAFTVAAIDYDNAVVPRGAFLKTASEVTRVNPAFEGLSRTAALDLSSYFHFRTPTVLPTKSLLERETLDKALDFLDTIDEDVPKGTWAVSVDRSKYNVSLHSLLWPGFVAYHVADTRRFGYVYFGTGERNMDIAFML